MLPEFSQQELRKYASQGPIVTFVHSNICHAVILTLKGTFTIELPDFEKSKCETQHEQFQRYLNLRGTEPEDARLVLESILIWLWNAAAEPIVSLIMEKLNIAGLGARPKVLPRVWWVYSGWINTFPIHLAEGYQRALETGEPCTVMYMVISSYTPTIQALGYTRRTMNRMTSEGPPNIPSAALVSMKITPNKAPDLPNAPMEVDQVEKILGSHYKVLTMGYPRGTFQDTATRKAVVYALHTCTIAHFACHGEAAEKDPLESRLCLYDWKARPLKVGLLMRMDFKHCQLVNLSACDMAVNRDQLLREEGLHMSGAFLMAGVPNAIATWWPIIDVYSVRVSRDFYTGLKNSKGVLDIAKAAETRSKGTTVDARSPIGRRELLSARVFEDQRFWFANFSVGNASNLSLLVDTGSSDLLLNVGKYTPSTSSQDLGHEFNLSFSTSNSDGTGSESMTVHTFQDTVTLSGSNFTIPSQALGVVKNPLSPPQFPHDGLIGFSGINNSFLNSESWFSNLCINHAFKECRFGLALGINETGTQYFGGVENDVFEGELSTAPLQEQWVTWGDVVFNGTIFEKGARMLMDSGTAVIFGPIDVVQKLFDAAGMQSQANLVPLNPQVNATILTGYYPCTYAPSFGFGFPSLNNISQEISNISSPVSNTSRVFNVVAEALAQESTNGNCTSIIHGVNDLDLWLGF
ncbi:hypothetical protein G7Y89_g2357 [Cudoniella acicularis]|uniref:Peptidase A1 domain-containing protein n=1 Tax=Cudoniella acicularis TaxID=354080 RepID=A0A8H4RVH6_9HELO|nr:hypothetical protein G7Y89_g2357 [Cudoniella acicularis]